MTIVEEGVSSIYAAPNTRGAVADYRPRYGHYIGGEWVDPDQGPVVREHLARQRQAVHRGRHAAPSKTSTEQWMPHGRPSRRGARPARPSAATCS